MNKAPRRSQEIPQSLAWKTVLKKIRGKLPDPLAFYCPVCMQKRVLDYRTHLQWRRLFQIFLLTGLVSAILWPILRWRGLLLFSVIFLYSEFNEWARVRDGFRCPKCGFDPRLPLSPAQREKMRVHVMARQKKESSSSEPNK